MMNLYRETENVKPKREIFKDFKSTIETSPGFRWAMIKKAEKAIKKVSVDDVVNLEAIDSLINQYELDDNRYGSHINKDLYALFQQKYADCQESKDRDLTQV